MMTKAQMLICFSMFSCWSLASAACNEMSKESCVADLAEPTGELHLLQANAKKVMHLKVDQTPETMGNDACKCIGINLNGSYPLKVDNDTVEYPAKAGSYCEAWDDNRYPGCEGYKGPDWCSSKWCYVDPCTCGLETPPKKSVTSFMWQGKPLYWSYATCGGTDTFSEGNDKACVNKKDETGCKSLDGCAWDGKLCLGKEIVDHCAVNDKLDEGIYGKSTCRCVGMAPKDGVVEITYNNQTAKYPGALGGNCSAWDDGVYPDCQGDSPPDWCKQKWCYVDPCSCKLDKSQPKETLTGATYRGNTVFWSYGTCGGEDKFTEDLDKLPEFPPAFCPSSTAKAPAPAPDAPIDLGKSECECVGLDLPGETPISATVADKNTGKEEVKSAMYPAAAGSSCKSWDVGTFPGCDVDEPPDWCSKKWCFVDPCKCSLEIPPKRTTQNFSWQGKQAFWSYDTCGDTDTFTAENPMACVSQGNKDYCEELEGCAWNGEKCLGKELVDNCKETPKEEVYGLKDCPCVGYEKAGYMNVTFDKMMVQYPASFGGNCSAWDDGNYPDCKADKPPDWCKQKWCYVDPCNCKLPEAQPKVTTSDAKYKNQPAYWSYATCGGKDTFTEDLSKLPAFPPDFCTAKEKAPEVKSNAQAKTSFVASVVLALAVMIQP